jgi:hypothetical protein
MLNNQRVHMTTLFYQPASGSQQNQHRIMAPSDRIIQGAALPSTNIWTISDWQFFPTWRRHKINGAGLRDSLSNKWGKTWENISLYISFIWKSIVKSVNKAGKCTQAGNWPRKMNLLASLMAQLPGVRMGLVFTTPQLSGNYIWIIFKYWSIWRT